MPKRRANGEGSIFKRQDGLWAAQYTDNAGKRRTVYGKSQQIVRQKLKDAINQSDAGIAVDKSKITFAAWMEEWLEVYKKNSVRESTYARNCNYIYSHIIPAFPKVLLKDLRTDMLQKFFNKKIAGGRLDRFKDPATGEMILKQGGLSTAVIQSLKQIIVQALNQAIDNNIITDNVAKKVKIPKRIFDEVSILSVDEQKKLEECVLKYRNPLAFAILLDLYTGLRAGELIGLKIGDLDFSKNELTIRRSRKRINVPKEKRTKIVTTEPKTTKGRRTIPLTTFISDMLKKYIEDRNQTIELMKGRWGDKWIDEGYVFITAFGTVLDPEYLRRIFNNCLANAGLEHIKFHALRHTFATRCLEAGFDIKSLSDILGHSDVKITLNTYAHALPEQKRSNMDKLIPLFNLENIQ